MRKYISIIIGIIIIAISIFIAISFINSKNTKKPKKNKQSKIAFTNVVYNKTIQLKINSTGSVVAKNKIEIYSEVQGVLRIPKRDFKAGSSYAKNDILLSINTEEHLSNLQASKSNFHNALLSIMPDIKVDFPSEYEKWQSYLSFFDVNKTLQELPLTSSDQEKFYVTRKNLYTLFYTVRNLEIRLSKYTIRAPYNGVLTEALVTPGTLIRQGQKLGEFINAHTYELELAINGSLIDLIKIGNSVTLNNIEQTKTWHGKVIRINGKIDQATQTIRVFIEIKSNDLREGMYLEADLIAKSVENAFEVDRKLLVDNNKLFAIEDTILYLVNITPVFYNDNTVIVTGLDNGITLISKPIQGAFEGMKVKTNKKNKAN